MRRWKIKEIIGCTWIKNELNNFRNIKWNKKNKWNRYKNRLYNVITKIAAVKWKCNGE